MTEPVNDEMSPEKIQEKFDAVIKALEEQSASDMANAERGKAAEKSGLKTKLLRWQKAGYPPDQEPDLTIVGFLPILGTAALKRDEQAPKSLETESPVREATLNQIDTWRKEAATFERRADIYTDLAQRIENLKNAIERYEKILSLESGNSEAKASLQSNLVKLRQIEIEGLIGELENQEDFKRLNQTTVTAEAIKSALASDISPDIQSRLLRLAEAIKVGIARRDDKRTKMGYFTSADALNDLEAVTKAIDDVQARIDHHETTYHDTRTGNVIQIDEASTLFKEQQVKLALNFAMKRKERAETDYMPGNPVKALELLKEAIEAPGLEEKYKNTLLGIQREWEEKERRWQKANLSMQGAQSEPDAIMRLIRVRRAREEYVDLPGLDEKEQVYLKEADEALCADIDQSILSGEEYLAPDKETEEILAQHAEDKTTALQVFIDALAEIGQVEKRLRQANIPKEQQSTNLTQAIARIAAFRARVKERQNRRTAIRMRYHEILGELNKARLAQAKVLFTELPVEMKSDVEMGLLYRRIEEDFDAGELITQANVQFDAGNLEECLRLCNKVITEQKGSPENRAEAQRWRSKTQIRSLANKILTAWKKEYFDIAEKLIHEFQTFPDSDLETGNYLDQTGQTLMLEDKLLELEERQRVSSIYDIETILQNVYSDFPELTPGHAVVEVNLVGVLGVPEAPGVADKVIEDYQKLDTILLHYEKIHQQVNARSIHRGILRDLEKRIRAILGKQLLEHLYKIREQAVPNVVRAYQLAEALNTIGVYLSSKDRELRRWAVIAYNEQRTEILIDANKWQEIVNLWKKAALAFTDDNEIWLALKQVERRIFLKLLDLALNECNHKTVLDLLHKKTEPFTPDLAFPFKFDLFNDADIKRREAIAAQMEEADRLLDEHEYIRLIEGLTRKAEQLNSSELVTKRDLIRDAVVRGLIEIIANKQTPYAQLAAAYATRRLLQPDVEEVILWLQNQRKKIFGGAEQQTNKANKFKIDLEIPLQNREENPLQSDQITKARALRQDLQWYIDAVWNYDDTPQTRQELISNLEDARENLQEQIDILENLIDLLHRRFAINGNAWIVARKTGNWKEAEAALEFCDPGKTGEHKKHNDADEFRLRLKRAQKIREELATAKDALEGTFGDEDFDLGLENCLSIKRILEAECHDQFPPDDPYGVIPITYFINDERNNLDVPYYAQVNDRKGKPIAYAYTRPEGLDEGPETVYLLLQRQSANLAEWNETVIAAKAINQQYQYEFVKVWKNAKPFSVNDRDGQTILKRIELEIFISECEQRVEELKKEPTIACSNKAVGLKAGLQECRRKLQKDLTAAIKAKDDFLKYEAELKARIQQAIENITRAQGDQDIALADESIAAAILYFLDEKTIRALPVTERHLMSSTDTSSQDSEEDSETGPETDPGVDKHSWIIKAIRRYRGAEESDGQDEFKPERQFSQFLEYVHTACGGSPQSQNSKRRFTLPRKRS